MMLFKQASVLNKIRPLLIWINGKSQALMKAVNPTIVKWCKRLKE